MLGWSIETAYELERECGALSLGECKRFGSHALKGFVDHGASMTVPHFRQVYARFDQTMIKCPRPFRVHPRSTAPPPCKVRGRSARPVPRRGSPAPAWYRPRG